MFLYEKTSVVQHAASATKSGCWMSHNVTTSPGLTVRQESSLFERMIGRVKEKGEGLPLRRTRLYLSLPKSQTSSD